MTKPPNLATERDGIKMLALVQRACRNLPIDLNTLKSDELLKFEEILEMIQETLRTIHEIDSENIIEVVNSNIKTIKSRVSGRIDALELAEDAKDKLHADCQIDRMDG